MRIKVVSYNIHKGLAAGNRRCVLGRIREALGELEPDIVLLTLGRIYPRNLTVERAEVLAGRAWQELSDHLPVSAVLSMTPRDPRELCA